MFKTVSLVALLVSGCIPSAILPGNDPDAGVSCLQSMAPSGTGNTQGPRSFAVGSSYQVSVQVFEPDSGVVTHTQLSLSLLQRAISCVDRADAGPGDGFYATVVVPGADRVSAGTYRGYDQVDGGPFFGGFEVVDGGTTRMSEGSLTLSAVQNCAVSGTFDVKFPSEDGGQTSLSGSFNSEYCN
jgi:hypothetical protein